MGLIGILIALLIILLIVSILWYAFMQIPPLAPFRWVVNVVFAIILVILILCLFTGNLTFPFLRIH